MPKQRSIFYVLIAIVCLTPFLVQVPLAASFQEDPVFKGLKSWVPLDGEAQDIGPSDTITVVNGCTPAPDRFGNKNRAMHFDGKDDFINLMIDINPSKMPEMSVAMWYKSERKWGVLFCHDNGEFDRSITLEDRDNIKGITALAGPKGTWFGGMNSPLNQWHMVIATWDAPHQKAVLYFKNKKIEVATCTKANPGEGWNFTQLGKSPTFNGHFQGSIDNVLIWNRVLTKDEAEDLLMHPEKLENAPRMKLVRLFDEGREMFQVGFYAQAVEKCKQALAGAGTKSSYLLGTQYLLESMKGAPLQYQGELFLAQYRILMEQENRAKLGVQAGNADGRVRVNYTFDSLPIYKAGIRTGDILTAVDGTQVQSVNDIVKQLSAKAPGDPVTVEYSRSGEKHQATFSLVQGQVNPLATAWAVNRLIDYGMLAAHAGHPALTRQAALGIQAIVQRYPCDLQSHYPKEASAILDALATAMEEGPGPAYERILRYGKLKVLGYYLTTWGEYFAPLYAEPKKLAYFLDEDAAKLRLPKPTPAKKEAFVAMDGRVIQPSGETPVLENKGTPGPAAGTKAKGTVLD